MASAVSRRVLLGRVPVLALAPPTRGLRSTIAARLPKAAAAAAALSPAGPEPITIRSYAVGSMQWMIPRAVAGAKGTGRTDRGSCSIEEPLHRDSEALEQAGEGQ